MKRKLFTIFTCTCLAISMTACSSNSKGDFSPTPSAVVDLANQNESESVDNSTDTNNSDDLASTDNNSDLIDSQDDTKNAVKLDYQGLSEKGEKVFKKLFVDVFSDNPDFQNYSLNFSMNTIGKEIDNSLFKDYKIEKNTILSFGKVSCPSCGENLKSLYEYAKNYDTNVVVIYYSDSKEDVETYLSDKDSTITDYIKFLSADDLIVSGSQFIDAFNVDLVPSMMFVDDKGKVGFTIVASPTYEYLEDITLSAFEGFIINEDDSETDSTTVRLYDLFDTTAPDKELGVGSIGILAK